MIKPWVLNTMWMAGCWREAAAFRKAIGRVEKVQGELLRSILVSNRETVYGRAHRFREIETPRAYQEAVPLTRYEDYTPYLGRICEGEGGVLTSERVEVLQPTSGTTAGEKLIPLTRTLRRQFQTAVASWMFDLLRHRPALRKGRAYWSISPAMPRRVTEGGVQIGFADDAEYLSSAEQWALRRLLVAPASVARIEEIEDFRYQTLGYLLAARDLTLVSVWSPTFLLGLVGMLEPWGERLCFDLRRGDVAGCDAGRARELGEILAANVGLAEKLSRIWRRLGLISCWTDAAAAEHVGPLQRLFPGVEFQGKGLMATEGCVSIPLVGYEAPVLALRSHFFEFQESQAPHRVQLAHELERGGKYRVIMTTGGGLYRYQLGDEIEARGYAGQCPMMRFLGKADGTSDLVGEKLSESHVSAVLQRVLASHGLAPRFTMLAPAAGSAPGYRLYLQDATRTVVPAELVEGIEKGLRENPHYDYARRLRQLREVEIVMLEPGGESAWGCYERACQERGQRMGNIKPVSLDHRPGWGEVFERLCVDRREPVAEKPVVEVARSL